MYNECRLRINNDFGSLDGADSLFIDDAVTADNGVVAFGNIHLDSLTVGIEDYDDIPPVIPPCIVLQAIGDSPFGTVKILQMLSDEVGAAKTEGWMVLAQGNQILVIFENLWVFRLVTPVQMIDAVR